MDYEKEYGGNIFVHSEASIESFPRNSPERFTNILRYPLCVSNDEEFVVGVINAHLPTTQYILLKNDIDSSITYNLGIFFTIEV